MPHNDTKFELEIGVDEYAALLRYRDRHAIPSIEAAAKMLVLDALGTATVERGGNR